MLSNISFYDRDEERHHPLFYRLSMIKTKVPYNYPKVPHHGKQAFNLGEYVLGLITNSL
jgi:primary-amine oxidase